MVEARLHGGDRVVICTPSMARSLERETAGHEGEIYMQCSHDTRTQAGQWFHVGANFPIPKKSVVNHSPVAQKMPQVISNYQGRFLTNWTQLCCYSRKSPSFVAAGSARWIGICRRRWPWCRRTTWRSGSPGPPSRTCTGTRCAKQGGERAGNFVFLPSLNIQLT